MRISRLLTVLFVGTVGLTTAVMADGTEAGTKITNSPTLSYVLGGVTKEDKARESSYIVDKVINFTVDLQESKEKSFIMGKSTLSQFLLTNRGNSIENFILEGSYGKSKAFSFSSTKIYVDKDGDGILDDNEKVHTPVLEKLGMGAKKVVWIEVKTSMMDKILGKKTDFGLMVRASSKGVDNIYTYQSEKNSMFKMDIIFADGSRDDDGARNNMVLNRYIWNTKESNSGSRLDILLTHNQVWSDPINGTNNPKAIPGAVVRNIWTIKNQTESVAKNIVFTATADTASEEVKQDKVGTQIEGSKKYKSVQYANDSLYQNITYGEVKGNRVTYTIPKIPAGKLRYIVFYTKIK